MPKQEPPPHPAEKTNRWMVTFADVITLLMTFFIFLVTYSTIETSALEQVQDYLVSSIGILPDTAVHERTTPETNENLFPRNPESHEDGSRSKTGDKDLERRLDRLSKNWSAAAEVDLSELKEKGVIRIERWMRFPAGSSKVPKEQDDFLNDLALVLRQESYRVVVQGYTDSQVDTFLTDLDGFRLAGERAANVAQHLIEKGKMTPGVMTVESFGKHDPRMQGEDAVQRAVNRRIGFLITLDQKKE